MRLAIFRDGPFLPPREGASSAIYGLIKELERKGVEVYLFRCYRGWDNPALYKKERFRTIFLRENDFYGKTPLVKGLMGKFGISLAQFDSPEILLCHTSLKRGGIKLIWEEHNLHSILSKELGKPASVIRRIRGIEKKTGEASDLILCRSEDDKARLISICPSAKAKIRLIRGSIDSSRLLPLKPDLKSRDVMLMGNFYYQPNARMVKIASGIYNHVGRGVRFILVGDAPRSLIDKYRRKGFIFKGFVSNLTPLLRKAALTISPIDTGSGTRMKMLDFLAAGIPVITTTKAIEGLDRNIKKVIFLEDKFDNYPKRIMELLDDPKSLHLYSGHGKRFVAECYSWNTQAYRYLDAYESLLENTL